jgi:hypothetical protein
MHICASPAIKKVVEELKRAHKKEGERIKHLAAESMKKDRRM